MLAFFNCNNDFLFYFYGGQLDRVQCILSDDRLFHSLSACCLFSNCMFLWFVIWNKQACCQGLDPQGQGQGLDPQGQGQGLDPQGQGQGLNPQGQTSRPRPRPRPRPSRIRPRPRPLLSRPRPRPQNLALRPGPRPRTTSLNIFNVAFNFLLYMIICNYIILLGGQINTAPL